MYILPLMWASLCRPVVGQAMNMNEDGIELAQGQQATFGRGEAVGRLAGALLGEGLVAEAEVVGVVAAVEVVPVEDGQVLVRGVGVPRWQAIGGRAACAACAAAAA